MVMTERSSSALPLQLLFTSQPILFVHSNDVDEHCSHKHISLSVTLIIS